MSRKNMARAALVLLLALTTVVQAAPPADWIGAPSAVAEYVTDPVFGGRVALYRAGPQNAETVVLVHGLGKMAARDWAKLIPALAERHRVLALDLPGFGHSDKGNHHYSPDNFARVLHAVLEKQVAKPFTLVGHSMGGSVALAYVAAYPQRVSRLVLVDAAGVLHRSVYTEFLARVAAQRAMGVDSPWFESVVRAIQHRMENWPLRGELVLENAGVRQRILRGDPNAISAFAMVEHDFSQSLRAITAPTLVIWGAEDRIAPLRTGQALASAIPRARLTVIEGAGHAPMLQFPERFNPIMLDELDGRQLAAPPYALPSTPVSGTRAARCDNRRDQEFSGDYESLVLDNCQDARISNARIGRLQATHSSARIVNSYVRDGIEAKNSRLELTGGGVGGRLTLDASNVDAAATRFESDAIASNSGKEPVVLRLSVAQVSRSSYTPRTLHDIFRLAPGETLIR
jgi:pimeloyl-ACP methyl ester carboxylesterase